VCPGRGFSGEVENVVKVTGVDINEFIVRHVTVIAAINRTNKTHLTEAVD